MKSYLIGETYEILDAIDQNNPEHIKEEAGDVLLSHYFSDRYTGGNQYYHSP